MKYLLARYTQATRCDGDERTAHNKIAKYLFPFFHSFVVVLFFTIHCVVWKSHFPAALVPIQLLAACLQSNNKKKKQRFLTTLIILLLEYTAALHCTARIDKEIIISHNRHSDHF